MNLLLKSFLTAAFALLHISINAQTTFQKTFGGPGEDVANWVTETNSGYLIAGYSTTGTNRDGYLLSLDFDGNTIWQKRFGGNMNDQLNAVIQTSGGYIVAGETQSYTSGGVEAWLLKISTAGTILWSKTYGDPSSDDYTTGIIEVSGGRYLVSSNRRDIGFNNQTTNFFLVDNTGTVIWSKNYQSGSGNLMRCNYVSDGIIYASGGAMGDAAFIQLELETGNFIQGRLYNGDDTEALYYLQPTADGNFLLCDHTHSASSPGQYQQWLKKVTPQGQTLWSKLYNMPGVNLRGRLESTNDGNYLLTPYDGDLSAAGDALLIKIDEFGNIMWSRNYGEAGSDWLWKSQATSDGGIISVGCKTVNGNNRNILVIKTDAEGLVTGCCIPPAQIVVQPYQHSEQELIVDPENWEIAVPVNAQQVNANLQSLPYCGAQPVEIFNDISLCQDEVFTYNGMDYYAPDQIDVVQPGLFGCDTIVHYNLLLLPPQAILTENISLCPEETFTINGQLYTAPDTVVQYLSSPVGCDTVKTYYLQIETDPAACITCKGTFLKLIGDAGIDFSGLGVYDAKDGNLYITGTKRDSALIMKTSVSGSIIWSRAFDIIPGQNDNIAEIIVDSDGMIAGAGQSGDAQPVAATFAFRYNPVSNNMIWVATEQNSSAFVLGLVEKGPGGNYIINTNPHVPENYVQLTELSRATGTVVNSPMTKQINLGGAENFNSMQVVNGKLYGVGRYSDSNNFISMRHTTSSIDLNTGQIDFTWMKHHFSNTPARLYGMDFVIEGQSMTSVGLGDENGEDLNNSKIFLYNGPMPTGNGGPSYRIDLLETNSDAVAEIVSVPNGHVLLCHSLYNSPADIILVRTGTLGNVVWAKKIDFGFEQFLPVSIVQSQIMVKDDFLYLVATTTTAFGEKRMMIAKMTLDGIIEGDCDYLKNTSVTSQLIPTTFGYDVTPQEFLGGDVFSNRNSSVFSNDPACVAVCRSMSFDTLIEVSICPGDSFDYNGLLFSGDTTAVFTFSAQNGCDSVVTLVVEILPQPTRAETIQFCPGESVSIGGQTYSQSGTVLDTIPGGNACDTIVTYTLVQLPQPTRAETIQFCPGESVSIGGLTYSQSGTVLDTIPGGNACDTIVTYTLIRLPQPTRAETIQFCPGESVSIGGQTYSQSGTVLDTIPGGNACDTIVTYTLVQLPQPTRAETIQFCPGESVSIGGQTYSQSGTVLDTIPGGNACDTIVTYTLIRLPQPTRAETIQFCPGESVSIGGQTYSQSGTVLDTIPGGNACDTIVTYTLIRLPQPTRAETIEFCPGESIVIDGQTYTQPGIVTQILPAAIGCDTIVTYTLQSLLPAPSDVNIQCPINISIIAEAGTAPLVVNYALPTASTDCPCPGVQLELSTGLPSGSLFPNGTTQVCYTASDSCGQTASCCFIVTIREIQACDTKVIGCMKYELLSITADADKNQTYRIRVTNSCPNKMIYTAIQLPDAVTAMQPTHLSTYLSPDGRDYEVRNPNFSPFYSIRFKSLSDSISNSESDIFKYTLPAQSDPDYIHVTSRLVPQLFFEAYLNTFYCPVGVTKPDHRDDEQEKDLAAISLFPNPSEGQIWIALQSWSGLPTNWQILNSQGQKVMEGAWEQADGLHSLELPKSLSPGLYFIEIKDEQGTREVMRFVLQH